MRVQLELLVPGVEDAEEADLCAKTFGVSRNLQQRLRAGAKQESVDDLLVLQCEPRKVVRQSKDDMEITDVQQFLLPFGQPAVAGVGLAFWAMPISTRNGELSITCLMGSLSLWGVEEARAPFGGFFR